MGGNMVRRLLGGGHECVVFDAKAANVASLAADGAAGSRSLDEFAACLTAYCPHDWIDRQ